VLAELVVAARYMPAYKNGSTACAAATSLPVVTIMQQNLS
jgi:hypothetical protein